MRFEKARYSRELEKGLIETGIHFYPPFNLGLGTLLFSTAQMGTTMVFFCLVHIVSLLSAFNLSLTPLNTSSRRFKTLLLTQIVRCSAPMASDRNPFHFFHTTILYGGGAGSGAGSTTSTLSRRFRSSMKTSPSVLGFKVI